MSRGRLLVHYYVTDTVKSQHIVEHNLPQRRNIKHILDCLSSIIYTLYNCKVKEYNKH